MYFSAENLPEVNPVVMNYKIRHNKNRPARYSLALLFCGDRKMEKCSLDMAMCKGSHGERLVHCESLPEY